jgi:hypothetical protein
MVRWCYGLVGCLAAECRFLKRLCFGWSACLQSSHTSLKVSRKYHWVFLTYITGPMEEGPAGYPTPVQCTPGGPAPPWRLATAGWSNPSEQRARTGLNQFVSVAQCVCSAAGRSVRTGDARRKDGNICEDDSRTGINGQRCGKLSP